jgi:hypothetical protein
MFVFYKVSERTILTLTAFLVSGFYTRLIIHYVGILCQVPYTSTVFDINKTSTFVKKVLVFMGLFNFIFN